MKAQKLFSYVRRAVSDYNMIKNGDKIAVGISGGKDSLTLLYALNGLRRFYPEKFDIVALTVDLGFGIQNFDTIEQFCKDMNVEYHVIKQRLLILFLRIERKLLLALFVQKCEKVLLMKLQKNWDVIK